jgi:hypothetical protein
MIYKHIGIVKGISQVVLPGFLSEDRVEEASCLPSMRFFAWLGEDELRRTNQLLGRTLVCVAYSRRSIYLFFLLKELLMVEI